MPSRHRPAQTASKDCPDDPGEVAEQYLLNRLAPDAAAKFEAHYIECEACEEVLGEVEDFIASIKEAARGLSQGDQLAQVPNSGLHIVQK
ncbi:MAG TPA: hypothetical protein VGF06_14985 [Terriglobales bacterium]|jgi:hypothetical protein